MVYFFKDVFFVILKYLFCLYEIMVKYYLFLYFIGLLIARPNWIFRSCSFLFFFFSAVFSAFFFAVILTNSTWRFRLQWAVPDLNSELHCSWQPRTSPGGFGADWATPDLTGEIAQRKNVRKHVKRNVARCARKTVRQYFEIQP